jgi:hypothetical protein
LAGDFFHRGFFRPERTLRRRATLAATGYREDAATNRVREGGRLSSTGTAAGPVDLGPVDLGPVDLGRSILANRRETDLASGYGSLPKVQTGANSWRREPANTSAGFPFFPLSFASSTAQ